MAAEKVVILGGGESGTGAALLAKKHGYAVQVSDFGSLQAKYRKRLEDADIPYEENGHSTHLLEGAILVIKSPGIAPTVPVMQTVIANSIPWVDEIEFAARYTRGKVAAITGSNGKTTTTNWLYHMLKTAGLSVGLAGNIGTSWAAQLCQNDYDYWVLELSSFQIDGLRKFAPEVGVLCNITPDHLDRYNNNISEYAAAKFALFSNQNSNQHQVLNASDPLTQEYTGQHASQAQVHWFGLENNGSNVAYTEGNQLIVKTQENNISMSIEELALHGKHNVQNAMAASVAANLLNIRKEAVRDSLENFQGIPHRLESVASIHGIEFINDSKATNVNATWWALESMDKPVVWVVGGVDKGNDYSELIPLVGEKVKAIVCLGKDNSKIIDKFSGIIPTIIETTSAQQAVDVAYQLGKKGDAVLLSPACASFDLFENYEDRGNQFKEAVRAL